MRHQLREALNFTPPFFVCVITGRRQLLRSLNVGLYRLGEIFQFNIKSSKTVLMERQPELATSASSSSRIEVTYLSQT
jgi:hypothetical protein